MDLPKELTREKAASFAFTWAIIWRIFAIFLVGNVLFGYIPIVAPEFAKNHLYALSTIEFIILFFISWFVIHRLLKTGFGQVKIVIIEESEYENLVGKLSNDKDL